LFSPVLDTKIFRYWKCFWWNYRIAQRVFIFSIYPITLCKEETVSFRRATTKECPSFYDGIISKSIRKLFLFII